MAVADEDDEASAACAACAVASLLLTGTFSGSRGAGRSSAAAWLRAHTVSGGQVTLAPPANAAVSEYVLASAE